MVGAIASEIEGNLAAYEAVLASYLLIQGSPMGIDEVLTPETNRL